MRQPKMINIKGSAQQQGARRYQVRRGRRTRNKHHKEALSTLQLMFLDMGYTTRHLDPVLQHHRSHIENAVKTTLIHGNGTFNKLLIELSRTPPPVSMVVSGGNERKSNNKQIDAAEFMRHLFGDIQRRQADVNDYPALMCSRNGVGGGVMSCRAWYSGC